MKTTLFTISLLISIFLPLSTYATMPSLETYGKLELISDMSISPSGNLIAYRFTKSDTEDYVVILSLIEGEVISAIDVKK